jgi:hypothetical protein
MTRNLRARSCSWFCAAGLAIATSSGCTTPAPTGSNLATGAWVRVVRTAADASTIVVVDPANATAGDRSLGAAVGPVREAVKLTLPGDTVRVEISADGRELTGISPVGVAVSPALRLGALGLGAIAVILPAWLVFGRRLRWVIIGEDNRYSTSKFQMALWTLAVLSSYLAAIALRGYRGGAFLAGGVEIPANVLWISGLSVLGFAGAKQIVVSRIRNAPATAFRVAKTASPTGGRFPRDLVTDDTGQRPDLGDIQMLLVSLIAAVTYLVHVFGWLGILHLNARVELPDIGSTMLGLFGAGQAAYLGKKLTDDTGAGAAPGPLSSDLPPKPPI